MEVSIFHKTWQAPLVRDETIVFFDSDCLMCQASLKWLNRIDAHDRLRFAPLSGKTARERGVSTAEDSMALILAGETYRASEAARLAFAEAGGVGCILALILQLIPFPLRDWGYRGIAKNRKALFKKKSCELPEEGMMRKLLD